MCWNLWQYNHEMYKMLNKIHNYGNFGLQKCQNIKFVYKSRAWSAAFTIQRAIFSSVQINKAG